MERLKAAQALLPQLALAAEPRRDEELQRLTEQGEYDNVDLVT